MIRRQFLASMSGAALLKAAKRPPNVVLILADDLGWGDVAMNGCPDIPTPHIDSIARQGVRLVLSLDTMTSPTSNDNTGVDRASA